MMPRFFPRLIATTSIMLMIFTGCSSNPPAEQFYTLTTGLSLSARPAQADSLVISIGAIGLPEQVDRPQIVTLDGQQRVSISEQHRWASSLQAQIAQVIAGGLAQRLDTPLVITHPQPEPRLPDVRITLSVQAFDAKPGQEVVVDALWSMRGTRTEQVVSSRALARAPINPGGDPYAAIASAYRSALDEIAQRVAEGVKSIQSR